MAISIRRAEQRDLPALGALGAMLMRTHYDFDPLRFLAAGADASEGYAWFLGNVMDLPDGALFVAEEDDAIAGYAYVELEPLSWKELRGPAGFIHDIAVREESRRSGVASALMDASLAWLRTKGAPRAILWTAAANEGAHALFKRIGFRDTMIEMTLELDTPAG